MVPRLVDCGYLTVRLIPGCQARVLADDVDRLVAQHARPASARDWGTIRPVEHIEQSHHATAKLPVELDSLSTTAVNGRGPPSIPCAELSIHGLKSWGRNFVWHFLDDYPCRLSSPRFSTLGSGSSAGSHGSGGR
ncbi:MAG TPA: hypothetical protein VN648_08585, partial [Candidatus Methylomirabilis sp.]|nr:hypothetical protein [Candidatus Methylomirabilis sp.]